MSEAQTIKRSTLHVAETTPALRKLWLQFGTSQYGSRGYCSQCFYLVSRIEWAKKWDPERPETQQRFHIPYGMSREKYIRQAHSQLRYYRAREEMRNGPVAPEMSA